MRQLTIIFILIIINIIKNKREFSEPKEREDKFYCKDEQRGEKYKIIYWTQYSDIKNEKQEGFVRILIYDGQEPQKLECPKIKIDSKIDKMSSRNELNPKTKCFSSLVCEYKIDEDDKEIYIITEDEKRFSIPKINLNPKSIGLIGDTGCKSKNQNCSNYLEWPSKLISESFFLI
jgi:hypothetical protein